MEMKWQVLGSFYPGNLYSRWFLLESNQINVFFADKAIIPQSKIYFSVIGLYISCTPPLASNIVLLRMAIKSVIEIEEYHMWDNNIIM